MLEWLDRKLRLPTCVPLGLSSPSGVPHLRKFLLSLWDRMDDRPVRTVVRKCSILLGGEKARPIHSSEGLWLDAEWLPALKLGFPVVVWSLNQDLASLERSDRWGSGPHSLAQVADACECKSHMCLYIGHFCPFPTSSLPRLEELIGQLIVAARLLFYLDVNTAVAEPAPLPQPAAEPNFPIFDAPPVGVRSRQPANRSAFVRMLRCRCNITSTG